MNKITAILTMGFVSISAAFAVGTSSSIENDIMDQKPTVEAQPSVQVQARKESEAQVHGVQVLTMGQARKPSSVEKVEQQREIIFVLGGPAQKIIAIKGPVLDHLRQDNIAAPKIGTAGPALLKGVSGERSLVAVAGGPNSGDSASVGGLWNWFFGSIVDPVESDADDMDEDSGDIEVIEVNFPYTD